MKKSLRILFVMMLALSIVLSLASCDLFGDDTHTHEFVDGECECGETDPDYEPPHEHTYVNGKCECGESDPNYNPSHEHSYTPEITEPTCETDGYTTYTCSCGDSYVSDEVDALGHTHSEVTVDPTCEEKGYTIYTCNCGDTFTDEIDALGHSYVNGKCDVCGEADPDYQPPKEPEIVSKALNIDNGQHIAALETVYNSGVDLINRAVAVYDISLDLDGVKVQPNGKILVSVPVLIPEILEYDVYHILADGSVENIVSTVVDGMITFETESFSDFVFVSDEKYNIGDYNVESTSTVQVFQTMTIEKYELFIGFNGIDSVDDVTVYINGEEFTDFVTEENSIYIFANQFYNGERITISVVPNNGYDFGSYALYTYNSETHAMEFEYYSESEISVTLNDKWAGIIGCELFAPDVDRQERDFDIAVSSQKISLEDLTFTINGVEMKGQNYVRDDGGCTYHLIPKVKNGDVMTVSVNLPAKCRFELFYLRDINGAIIEEVTTNSITFKIESTTGSLDLRIEELEYLGVMVHGAYVGWSHVYNDRDHNTAHTTVLKGSLDTTPADFDFWIYTDYQEYLLTLGEDYTVDLGGFDINKVGVYTVFYDNLHDPEFDLVLTVTVKDVYDINCDFSTLPDGTQYANEKNTLADGVIVSTHNDGCYFATQLRIYDSNLNDGHAIVCAPGVITSITFSAGHNNATLKIYGSKDGETWFEVKDVTVAKDYATYTVEVNHNYNYDYLKLDADGGQIRIQSLTLSILADMDGIEKIACDFSTLPEGTQYANETYTIVDGITVSTYNEGCYVTTQLRIYDSNLNDGYAIVSAFAPISSITLSAGHTAATLKIYGSTDGVSWVEIGDVSVTKDYATHTLTLNYNNDYTYIKLDAEGGQIRIQSLDLYILQEDSKN